MVDFSKKTATAKSKIQSNANEAAALDAIAHQDTRNSHQDDKNATDANEFLDSDKNDTLEFETKSNGARVWEYTEGSQITGVFLGEGKTLGEGTKATKTWLIGIPDNGKFGSMIISEYVFVPQWHSVKALENETELGASVARFTYKKTTVKGDGGKYHDVKLEVAPLAVPYEINKHFDLTVNK